MSGKTKSPGYEADTFFTRSGSSPPSTPTNLGLLEDVPRESIPDVLAEIERVRSRLLLRLHEPEKASHQDTVLLTADEVAERLGASRQWVYRHADELGGIRLTRKKLRFRHSEIERYLRRRRSHG